MKKKANRYHEIVETILFKRNLFIKKYNAFPNSIFMNEKQLEWFREKYVCCEITHIFGMEVHIDETIKTDYDIKIMLELKEGK